MTNDVHEAIKARLEQHGVTDPDHVGAALEAHDDGVDVQQIQADIAAGVPQWLALLRALRAAKPRAKGKAKHGS